MLVAESRLMLDEHWPSDVVAGMLLGGACSCIALMTENNRAER
jgi:membrane-associated phospholipid phosphatase